MKVSEIYSDAEFNDMGWHDNRVYNIGIPTEDNKFKLDIDYIFEWSKEGDEYSGFWVSPCEIVFKDVYGLKINIDFTQYVLLFISTITRENKRLSPNGKAEIWDYKIELDNGSIEFSATGFEQFVKEQPVFSDSQALGR